MVWAAAALVKVLRHDADGAARTRMGPAGHASSMNRNRSIEPTRPVIETGAISIGFASAAVALATILVVVYVWGSLHPIPVVHDEWAYVLQCEIFATGRWTVPSPPLPEFFEQLWVFVEPVVASKYWPGHSLLMTPGCMVAMPSLVPLLLSGLTGALLFRLTAARTSVGLALLAWALWLTSAPNLHFRAMYFANVTTCALWLGALACASRWERTRQFLPLALMMVLLAWMAITRPLTGLALGAPLVIYAGWRLRDHPFRFVQAAVLGSLVLLILPLWSWTTLGSVRTVPYMEYARLYFPFDGVGLTFDATPPARTLPPELSRYGDRLAEHFRSHTPARLPLIAAERMAALGGQLFEAWRGVLVLFAIAGAIDATRHKRSWLALPAISASALFAGHLTFAHPAEWTHYYFEAFPLVWVIVALGVWAITAQLPASRRARRVVITVLLITAAMDVPRVRSRTIRWRERVEVASAKVDAIPGPAVVFVEPEHAVSPYGLVHNSTSLSHDRVWVVRDRGDDNQRLLSRAKGRRPYLLNPNTLSLRSLE
jgi:hypothetical protein